MVEVFNPKATLFFVAFLPQFIGTSAGFPVWARFALLGMIVGPGIHLALQKS
jgi:threonine/homoserine/homoserine lactone efflux protein